MKTSEKVKSLLRSNGHKVIGEVPDSLYEKFLVEVHAGDYKDTMSDLEEQELAQYMAATFGVQTSSVAAPALTWLRRANISCGKNMAVVDATWKAAMVVLMLVLCLKGC